MSERVERDALQGEKCAHAPEIPVRLFRIPGIDHLFVAREDYLRLEEELRVLREERDRYLAQANELHDQHVQTFNQLARERESRKQAEAALRAYMFCEQTNAGRNPHNPGTNRHRAFELGRAALASIPQEPAEPESGK